MKYHIFLMIGLLVTSLSSCRSLAEVESGYDPDREMTSLLDSMQEGVNARSLRELRLRAEGIVLRAPRHSGALTAAGILAYEDADLLNAQVLLDRALAINPGASGAAVARARVAVDQGNLELATRLLKSGIRQDPADAFIREALAGVLFMGGQLEDSLVRIDEAENLGAPIWRVAFHRGLVHESLGQIEEAEASYALALQHCPDDELTERRLLGLKAARTE